MKNILCLLCLISASTVFAQNMETERPGESMVPHVIDKSTAGIESGIKKEKQNSDTYIQHPNLLLRWGINNKVELRLESNVATQKIVSQNIRKSALTPLETGLKAQVFETPNKNFTIGSVLQIGLPFLSSYDYKPEHAYYRMRLLFENKLSQNIKLVYNAGREWDNKNNEQNWVYSITPQLQISKQWQVFVEEYSYMKNGSYPEHIADAGFAYQIKDMIQMDVSGGKGLNGHSPEYFWAFGISLFLK